MFLQESISAFQELINLFLRSERIYEAALFDLEKVIVEESLMFRALCKAKQYRREEQATFTTHSVVLPTSFVNCSVCPSESALSLSSVLLEAALVGGSVGIDHMGFALFAVSLPVAVVAVHYRPIHPRVDLYSQAVPHLFLMGGAIWMMHFQHLHLSVVDTPIGKLDGLQRAGRELSPLCVQEGL